jgi:thioredoxin-related protein
VLIYSLVFLYSKYSHKYNNLKKIYQILVILFFATSAFAQEKMPADTTKPIVQPKIPTYERLNEVPPFNLLVVNDSTMYAKANLAKKKKTMIFIFSPSCEHCKHATEDIIKNYSKFKNTNIVMATVTKYEYTKKFYEEYNLKDYPNIKVGVDADYFLGRFYEVRNYPSIFVYDKKGFFKKFYNSSYKILDVAKDL